MNWTNYRRLVTDLEQLLKTEPQRFDYGSQDLDAHAGCIACRVCAIDPDEMARTRRERGWNASRASIRRFLDCSDADADDLFFGDAATGVGFTHGEVGIRFALKNLQAVAARYGGEPSAPFVANESKYLADLKTTIHQPIHEDAL